MNHVARRFMKAGAVAIAAALHFSSAALAAPTPIDPSWITNDKEVLADAIKITKTLPRKVIVYHWVPSKIVGFVDEFEPVNTAAPEFLRAVRENIESRMSRFWDISIPISGVTWAGVKAPNGFYVATDPVISSSYGNMIYQLELPQGLRYIDGRPGVRIGQRLAAELKRRACYQFSSSESLIQSRTEDLNCRKLILEIAAATNAAAVAYDFDITPIRFCTDLITKGSSSASFRNSPAFVLFSPESIPMESVKALLWGRSFPSDGLDREREIINGIFNLVYGSDYAFRSRFRAVPVARENDTKAYLRINLFGCNPDFKKAE